jgi:glycerate kinase
MAGKGPGALAGRAMASGKPAHVFAGRVDSDPGWAGALLVHAVTPPGTPLDRALRESAANLAAAVVRAFS